MRAHNYLPGAARWKAKHRRALAQGAGKRRKVAQHYWVQSPVWRLLAITHQEVPRLVQRNPPRVTLGAQQPPRGIHSQSLKAPLVAHL